MTKSDFLNNAKYEILIEAQKHFYQNGSLKLIGAKFNGLELTKDLIETFQIGFNPVDNLFIKFLYKKYPPNEFPEIQNISKMMQFQYGDDINVKGADRFENRITIPSIDEKNKIKAILGYNPSSFPRFKFATPTRHFTPMIGLYQAMPFIKSKQEVICVHSIFDLFKNHKEGFKNTVCIPYAYVDQIMILKQLSNCNFKFSACFNEAAEIQINSIINSHELNLK